MGTHPIFESDFDCLTEMDYEVVKTEAQEFDRWVTGLVDLIPTQVYISKDMLPTKTEDEKNLSKSEKRKRRLDPEQCLTTSKLAFKNLEETQMDSNLTESNINPSDLRAKFDAKMAEIREKQRLAELEEDNPEKAELLKEKKRWKDAETRLKGEKVRDDAKLLAKSVKRREQQKKASQKKWAERTE